MELEEVYGKYFPDVYRFCLSLTGSRDEAEEVTQDCFFKALHAIDRFDGRMDIRAWLFTIARNDYYSKLRREKRLTGLDAVESSGSTTVEELLMDRESAFLVHQYLHTMPEPYKEVFSLRVFGELEYAQIGRLFGKSAGWARVTYYRAKQQIQCYMEDLDHE